MSATFQASKQSPEAVGIRSVARPDCYVCGAAGELLHEHLRDRLFGAPGSWNIRKCLNPRCGLAWLDPMPFEEDIDRAYQRYYTHEEDSAVPDNVAHRAYRAVREGYLASRYGYEKGYELVRFLGCLIYLNPIRRANSDASVFFLSHKQNGRLLEVGCGNGASLKVLENLGWQVEGVDFDPAAVECARRRGLGVHLGTLAAQKFPADTFDAVVSNHVIEHVSDPVSLLRECFRVLKPGGRLVVITPNVECWGHRIYGADWRGLEPPRHLHIFTVDSLAAICAKAGFRTCTCHSMVRAIGISLPSRMLKRKGKGKVGSEVTSFAFRLWAEAIGLVQWASLLFDREAGEEIVLTCPKRVIQEPITQSRPERAGAG